MSIKYRTNKVIKALYNYGIWEFMIKFIKKVTYRVFAFFDRYDQKLSQKRIEKKRKYRKEYKKIEELFNNRKYKYIFVFYPYTEWKLPIFQRPQQIALSMTNNREDVLYFYCTANNLYDSVDTLEKINENLYLCTDYDFLMNLKTNKRILHLYSTDIVSSLETVKAAINNNDKVLYEYIDEIHEDITQSIPKEFYAKHEFLLKNEECFIIATANKLYNDVKKKRNKNFALSTNGVNIDDFIGFDKIQIPSIIKEIKSKYEKVICYYGALAKWVDYDLIKSVAKKYNKYAFVLIGIEYDDSLKKSNISEQPNIFFIGKVEYSDLVKYSSNMDLLTIPFLINEITESTSPVKLFEYMAVKKPILTTAINECKKYKSVNIAESREKFIDMVPTVMDKVNNERYRELLYKEALDNSWKNKANIILDLISNNKGGRK